MLTAVEHLTYVIILCEDLARMKAFYQDLFGFPIETQTAESMSFRAGSVLLGLRKRTRAYDGRSIDAASPGLQLAFRVSPTDVDQCYDQLLAKGVPILDPPTDQPRGHRTVYFSDPEGNLLEVYAEI